MHWRRLRPCPSACNPACEIGRCEGRSIDKGRIIGLDSSGISYARSYRTLRDGSFEGRFPRHFVPGYDRCCPYGTRLQTFRNSIQLASSKFSPVRQQQRTRTSTITIEERKRVRGRDFEENL